MTTYDDPPHQRYKMATRFGEGPVMAPHEVALESFHYWTSLSKFRKYKRTSALGMMAMEDGETSFRLGVVGDHGHAWGPFQHQLKRRAAIREQTGTDIATSGHLDALAGADYEINKIPPYRHIGEQVDALTDPTEIVRLLVTKFEQSANPDDRDVHRRLNLYNFWDGELQRLSL